ncbi:hypothetical protein HOD38_04550 [archaeon]|jgi:orotate phosphoribosyltransferase|nr:hypothetical protein [archaeon]MBT4397512.1 hypothetical protein [archaeon]MBT4440856.1 hypothetical protein [archaeon]
MDFEDRLLDNFGLDLPEGKHVLGFFPDGRTLKSQRTSHWYVNWRIPMADVFTAEGIADAVVAKAQELGLEVDSFYGVQEGATKLGILAQLKLAKFSGTYGTGSHVLSMGRGKSKSHGDPADRYFLGVPQNRTCVLEDVTTTAGSTLERVADLRDAAVDVRSVISLFNRDELTPIVGQDDSEVVDAFVNVWRRLTDDVYPGAMSVPEAFEMLGIGYHSMANAQSVLKRAYDLRGPDRDIGRAIEQEFIDYGSGMIEL